jgi:Amt family ammonium transporter
MIFQAMFAVITPALILGAFAERMKFSSFVVFIILWLTLVYTPVCHWVWGMGGFLRNMGALDFAGGTVVHINAGIAALVTALMIGPRKNAAKHIPSPHNLPFVALGTALLWFGWFGFNAGSSLAANGLAANAFVVTNTAAAAAGLSWAAIEWFRNGKPTLFGCCGRSCCDHACGRFRERGGCSDHRSSGQCILLSRGGGDQAKTGLR